MLSGIGSLSVVQLHIAVADSRGVVIGGHLCAGSLVRTTAELVIGLLPEWQFSRVPHHCLLQRGYRCAEVFVYECLTDRPAAVLQGGPVNLSVPLAVLAASLRHRRWRPSARRWPSDRDSGTPNTVSAADWTRGEPEGYETNMWFHWNRVNDSIQTCASRPLGLCAVARL